LNLSHFAIQDNELNLLSKLTGLVSRRTSDPSRKVKSNITQDGEEYWWGGGRWLTGIFGGGTTSAGNAFTDEQAMAITAVYACSRAIAENLASLPGLVYRQEPRQRTLDRDGIPWQLLHDEPNPEMDSMTFWELLTVRMENLGNGMAEIERDSRDNPIALWPIHNSRVEPHRVEGKIEWRVSTDIFDPRIERYRYYTIPDRDMLNIVNFGGNGYLAPGTIPYGQEQIGFALATHQYGSRFFKQGGRPQGIVEMPGYIDDADERMEFRASLNGLHSGVDNWHKTAVLWNGGKWKELQYSPEQLMFIASQSFSDKRICQMYRVPPAIVQIFDDYKFSSVDAMLQSFVMTCLRPVAVRQERAVNRRLLRYRNARGMLVDAFDGPRIFEFLLEALLRGDAKKQAETLEIKRRNGIMNANEWRALDNDPPLPGEQGELYIVPGGFGRLDMIQGPGAKPEQQNNQQQQGQKNQASSAVFDPHAKLPGCNVSLIEAVESMVPRSASVRGADVESQSELREVADEVLAEAVGRVESVARTELARIRKISDASVKAAKLSDLRAKHHARLESAVLPAAKIYCRLPEHGQVEPTELVRQLASEQLGRFDQLEP
jgi:HK97 family phage portal protein